MGKAYSNIVKKPALREVQSWTLNALKDAVINSAGPYGSTTQILNGDPQAAQGILPQYSKDGHTILKSIRFNRALEEAIRRETVEMTRYIVKEVGDGTTSTVVLSSIIFDALAKIESNYPQYKIIEIFQNIVSEIKEEINKNGREMTLEDVYNIAMICTNSNERVSKTIADIYKKHGLDVFIDVAASNTDHDVIKSYDGLTLQVGYSDPVYVNTMPTKSTDEKAGYSIIKDARIYAFVDPIDTLEMTNFFNKIVSDNIMKPMYEYSKTGNKKYLDDVVPTVIMAPKISLDMNNSFQEIVSFLYSFNENIQYKPPLLIITNINEVNIEAYSDIWMLSGCKPIKKYIDPEIQKMEQENGKAPTMDNISTEFYGLVKEVKADAFKTTFFEPSGMFAYDDNGNIKLNEDGSRVLSNSYTGQLNFLEQELKVAIDSNEPLDVIGGLRRRIHSLKANMVDYFVGGVNITDRDSVRDLVEDAVKNIRSAAIDGVGYGTNYEGLRASKIIKDKYSTYDEDNLNRVISNIIYDSYYKMSRILYLSKYGNQSEFVEETTFVDRLIDDSLENGCPLNFTKSVFDGKVLCTIKQDPTILDVIAKIITIMVTTNQALIQTVGHNLYMAEEDL